MDEKDTKAGNSGDFKRSKIIVSTDSKPVYTGTTHCIVCNEKIDARYEISVKDKKLDNEMKSHICRDCFNSFLERHDKKNIFRLSKLFHKRDTRFRSFRV